MPDPDVVVTDALNDVDGAHVRALEARTKSILTHNDLKMIAEGLLLRIHVAFETFVREQLFCVVAGTSQFTFADGPVVGMTKDQIARIIYMETNRLSWLPIVSAENRADALLTSENPFSRVKWRNLALTTLTHLHICRNRIAHDGEEARVKYEKLVAKGDAGLAEPGNWLLNPPAGVKGVDDNLRYVLKVVRDVVTALSVEAVNLDVLLGPVGHVEPATVAAIGNYKCVACAAHFRINVSGDRLPVCTSAICSGVSGVKWIFDAR